jgi:hypothetical protein
MKFRFEVLSGETARLADKAEVTVIVWVTADLGGLQIERQSGVLRMYADEMRKLESTLTDGSDANPDLTLEFEYRAA